MPKDYTLNNQYTAVAVELKGERYHVSFYEDDGDKSTIIIVSNYAAVIALLNQNLVRIEHS